MKRAIIDCPVCDGEGVHPDPLSDGLVDMECEACGGEGWLEVEIDYDEEDPS